MTPKEYLSRYRNLDKEIDSLVLERERLYSLATKRGGSIIDGAPKNLRADNTASYEHILDKVMDIDLQINGHIDNLIKIRHEIAATIEGVDDNTLRTLLRLRYINGHTFEQIAVALNYSWRHIIRLHGQALEVVRMPTTQNQS